MRLGRSEMLEKLGNVIRIYEPEYVNRQIATAKKLKGDVSEMLGEVA